MFGTYHLIHINNLTPNDLPFLLQPGKALRVINSALEGYSHNKVYGLNEYIQSINRYSKNDSQYIGGIRYSRPSGLTAA